MPEEKAWSQGEVVEFVDDLGVPHDALVTAWWGEGDAEQGPPSVNLVYVDRTPGSRDTYGQQLVRSTSVVHESNQAAPGMFWRRK